MHIFVVLKYVPISFFVDQFPRGLMVELGKASHMCTTNRHTNKTEVKY